MSVSPGDAAKQEANAQKGRFIDRDLEQLVYGHIADRSRLTRNLRRHRRIDRLEGNMEGEHGHYEEKDVHGNPWRRIERIYFMGFILSEGEYENMMDRLEGLRQQVTQLIDIHEESLFDSLLAAEVCTGKLGGLGVQLSDFAANKYSFKDLWQES